MRLEQLKEFESGVMLYNPCTKLDFGFFLHGLKCFTKGDQFFAFPRFSLMRKTASPHPQLSPVSLSQQCRHND